MIPFRFILQHISEMKNIPRKTNLNKIMKKLFKFLFIRGKNTLKNSIMNVNVKLQTRLTVTINKFSLI